MSKQTFDIFNDAGMTLATITLYNIGFNTANREVVKIAESLSDKWVIAVVDEKEPTISTATESSRWVSGYVE